MCHKRHEPYTKDYKIGSSKSDTSTTPAKYLSRSIPCKYRPIGSSDPLHPLNLQPKEHQLYVCGVSHIYTGESMSSPPQQYKTEVLVI